MAITRICSVDGCGKPHEARGLCGPHYLRWRRHGDPRAGRTPNGEAERYFRKVVLSHDDDNCLQWPYLRNADGYAVLSQTDGLRLVSRLTCEAMHGPPPTEIHEAAHSCGQGHSGCVAPRHLSWKTRRANLADRHEHGTDNRGERHWNVKLTEIDAIAIRSLKGKESARSLGARFGVHPSTIRSIFNNASWSWL